MPARHEEVVQRIDPRHTQHLGEQRTQRAVLLGPHLLPDNGFRWFGLDRQQRLPRHDDRVRVGAEPREQVDQLLDEAGGGVPVEQVRGEVQHALDARGRAVGGPVVAQVQFEVEPGGGARRVELVHAQPGEACQRGGFVLEDQHHLEQRVVRQRARGAQQLDEPFHRDVLVGVGAEVGLPHAVQQLAETRLAVRGRAQHHGVDEVADQFLQHGLRAARGHRADRDVGARAQSGQQRRQARVQHHEHGGAGGPGQAQDLAVQPGRDPHGDRVAAVAGHGRARAVAGQFDPGRQVVQHFLPVLGTGAGQLALPEHEVRVLHGKRLPVRCRPGHAGGVGPREVAQQRSLRPAVAHDVVGGDQ